MRVSELTLRDLARLLGRRGDDSRGSRQHQHIIEDDEDDEDYMTVEDDDDELYGHQRRTRSRPFFPPVTEPQKEGLELLASGDFGRVGVKNRTRRNRRNIARTVLNQGKNPVPLSNREDILTVCIFV